MSARDNISTIDAPAPGPARTVSRRGAQRHRLAAPVRWEGGSGITVNMSKTGLLFDTDSQLEAGQLLKIVLAVEDARPARKPTYAFCDVLVLRVHPNNDGTWRVACAIKRTRIDR